MYRSVQAPARRKRGFTLVELCVTVAVAAVVLAIAAPSLQRLIQRTRLRGSASMVRTDLQYVRSAAVARNELLWLEWQASGNGSCYVIHDGAQGGCHCTPDGHASCDAPASALRVAGFSNTGPVQVSANVKAMHFDPVRGTVTPTGTFVLSTSSGDEVRHIVNVLGRVKSCSPATTPGYAPCNG